MRRQLPSILGSLQTDVIDALVNMVAAEGPVLTDRVYQHYAQATRKIRIDAEERTILDNAVIAALQRNLLAQVGAGDIKAFPKTLYLPSAPAILLRRKGTRQFTEIPPSELAAAASTIINLDGSATNSALRDRLSMLYELSTLDESELQHIDNAIALARPTKDWSD